MAAIAPATYGIPDTTLDELLQQRLFAVTRRSLHADLQILTEQGWLKRQGRQYYRVHDFPNRPARGIGYDNPTEPVAQEDWEAIQPTAKLFYSELHTSNSDVPYSQKLGLLTTDEDTEF